MTLDPRFFEIHSKLNTAINAANANNDQTVLENLYYIREIAWAINSDILAKRWRGRPRHSIPKPQRATIDDLLI